MGLDNFDLNPFLWKRSMFNFHNFLGVEVERDREREGGREDGRERCLCDCISLASDALGFYLH